MKFRIALQRYDDEGVPSEFRNLMVESEEDIDVLYERLVLAFPPRLSSRVSLPSRDVFDFDSKGWDVSDEEFFLNETEWKNI